MKPKHFFSFFGFAATCAGILSGALLLFQKMIAREVFISNVTLAIATITLLLAGAQILCIGLASEMLARTHRESQDKPTYVSGAMKDSDEEVRISREVAARVHVDNGNHLEKHPNPSPLRPQAGPERPVLMVSAHQPRLVRKIARNRLA